MPEYTVRVITKDNGKTSIQYVAVDAEAKAIIKAKYPVEGFVPVASKKAGKGKQEALNNEASFKQQKKVTSTKKK